MAEGFAQARRLLAEGRSVVYDHANHSRRNRDRCRRVAMQAGATFRLVWTPRDEVTAPTEIAVPAALFPDGFTVVLDGDEVADPDHDPATSTLRIPADAGSTGGDHELCLAPTGSTACP